MSKMLYHTPGPWKIDNRQTGPRCAATLWGKGTFIGGAAYKDCPDASPTVCFIPETEEKLDDEQYREGDARLIAAAPELLRQLKLAQIHIALPRLIGRWKLLRETHALIKSITERS